MENAKAAEELKMRLDEMAYGEVAVVALTERGNYALVDDESSVKFDSKTGASKALMGGLSELAEGLVKSDEDLITVQRATDGHALVAEDFRYFLSELTGKNHLIFVQCLELGTSEIRGFLQALVDSGKLAASKVFLLDLPQIEYMTLRDKMQGIMKF
ncbi:MAG: hypothetical protein LBI43_01275 [Streptococcaceae bacterium]|jgi:hypothetical protein|nr:hypothetical protein [Streptococcaceae bacterium]